MNSSSFAFREALGERQNVIAVHTSNSTHQLIVCHCSVSTAASTGGGSGSAHIKSSPRSSPSLKHSQVSQSENTSIDMPRVEDQSDVRMQPPTPQGNHAPSQTGGSVYLSGWHMYVDVGLGIVAL